MKKLIIAILALGTFSAFAGTVMSVKNKIISVTNVGSLDAPEAQVQLAIDTVVSSANQIHNESWILLLKADGTLNEMTGPSSKLSADYKVVQKMNLGSANAPIKASLYRINVKYSSKVEELQNSSLVLVKENGEVQIIE